jgi:outer membrane protein assembly factor BamA
VLAANAVQLGTAMISRVLLLTAVFAFGVSGWNQDEPPNVNSRYIVESVHVSGKKLSRLKDATRRELEAFVGQKFDHATLNKFAARLKRELRVEDVGLHVSKGTKPDHVKVEFAIENPHQKDFDIDIPKGVYHSRQGWSGAVESTTSIGDNDISVGVVSDGDALVERFAGVRARYERNSLGTDRVRLRFAVDSYHDQWNSSTVNALTGDRALGDLYRARMNFQPSVTFVIAQPLTLTVGVSVERLESQLPGAKTESANSVINTLRYHRRWENGNSNRHELDAGYYLRAATGILGSDSAYSRHTWTASYRFQHEHSTVAADFLAGRIGGEAPLFERFVLGNASTLRGWNKFDLDPLGGDRVVHGSVEYSYRGLQVFYDTGAIWTAVTDPDRKQSVGAGFGRAGKDGFLIAMAFPLRHGHIDPLLIAGFNF